ncbi:GntR family transcriptional regulator [Psychromonas sp. KJ10-2]|uniref:GntR family transcriptional regulator n=1 Tax=Psychromonas sp. KJ10-2 TaxID=3391822 RepID=UPI0039B5C769
MSNDTKIYQKILNAIVEHQLPPGSKLPEDKLSEVFGVSRTGIRKVLQRLAVEQFVTIKTNRGAYVNSPSEKEANEVLNTRILLEPLLITDILKNWNKAHSDQFKKSVKKEKVAEKNKNLPEAIQLTAQFHYELAKLSGNDLLADFIKKLCFRSSLVVAAYGSKHSVSCECGDHNELLNLIDENKEEEAKIWMSRHLEIIKASLNLNIKNDTQINFKDIF